MSIASGYHIGQMKPSLATPPGAAPSAGPNSHVTKADQEDFEKSLEVPSTGGWGPANDKQFALSIFQMEHGHSMAHDARMKEIWDGMNDSGKSKQHHRQG